MLIKPIKQKVFRRLKIIKGQLTGLEKMIADEKYCIDIITQLSAVRQALSGVEDLVLENHLLTCVAGQMKSNRSRESAEEILKVYKLSKRK